MVSKQVFTILAVCLLISCTLLSSARGMVPMKDNIQGKVQSAANGEVTTPAVADDVEEVTDTAQASAEMSQDGAKAAAGKLGGGLPTGRR